MNIAICGSMQFSKEMLDLKSQLEAMGHVVETPKHTNAYASGEKLIETKWEKVEGDVIRSYFEKIKNADAILVVNKTKNDIEHYIGGNGLLEMGFAHVLNKKIFLLHSIPSMSYSDEIASMHPIILNGDLDAIRVDSESHHATLASHISPLASHISPLTSHVSPLSSSYAVPRTGVGVMILREGKVLLGKRKGAHGEGEYAFPGGHLELMESYAECAHRELAEECGVKVKNIRFQFTANSHHFTPKHYVHIGLIADWESGEAIVLEPDKCESWDWYALDALPEPMFIYCRLAMDCYHTGKICIDSDGRDLSS
jgi:8-oxo-dGTP diphosphatase